MSLSLLLSDTAALLNDQNFYFMSQAQLTRWINESRKKVARYTGCIRRRIAGQSAFGAGAQPGLAIPGAMQPGALPDAFPLSVTGAIGAVTNRMQTIPGVERYPYQGFFNPVLRATYAGADEVIDAIALSVSRGGSTRPALDWLPWDDFQAWCRAYGTLNSAFPAIWSVYNDGPQGEIWLYPPPSQAGDIELDASVTPAPLFKDEDVELIPEGFYDAIKFGAAELAYMTSQRYAQAEMMRGKLMEEIGSGRVAVDRGKTPSYYR